MPNGGELRILGIMKTKVALIILLLVCLFLAGGLLHLNQKAEEQHKDDTAVILQHSNDLFSTSKRLEEEREANLKLTKDVAERKEDISRLSNNLSQTAENLARTESALKAAQAEAAKRDARIAELETQKTSLDNEAADLRTKLGSLEKQIVNTQKRLAAADGDRSFLQKELNRLMAEKTELERKFIDLDVLRAQVTKLKKELLSAKLAQWSRDHVQENASRRGAERQRDFGPIFRTNAAPRSTDLNVEVKSTGGARILPPGPATTPLPAPAPAAGTNAPAPAKAPVVVIKPAPGTNGPAAPAKTP